jgi:hypothetical protein
VEFVLKKIRFRQNFVVFYFKSSKIFKFDKIIQSTNFRKNEKLYDD